MDKLNKFLDYTAAFTSTWNWAVIGSVFGAIFVTIGITAWIQRRHLRKHLEKLATVYTILNVGFWGFVTTVTAFIATQGATFVGLLPFLGTHWGQISAGAITLHAIAKGLHTWWVARKAQKSLLSPATVEAIQEAAANLPEQPNPTLSTPVRKPSDSPLTTDVWS